ncbi:MAG: PEGA domain-containing protein [Spirochaetota bacterium]
MKFFKTGFISFVLINIFILFPNIGFADIIKKAPYSIQPKVKHKDNLNILILPFNGELSDERKYIIEYIKDYLGDKILLYKKLRFLYKFNDFKSNAFNSDEKFKIKNENNINAEILNDEKRYDGFLELQIIDVKKTDVAAEIIDINSQELIAIPGTDIIITGALTQYKNNLKIKVKIINNIYAKVFQIEDEGTFKNINILLDQIAQEAIKSIIFHYSFLNIFCNEKNSGIYVDDRYFGRTDRTGILLESGDHKVVVLKEKVAEKTTNINIAEKTSASLQINFSSADLFHKNSIKITTTPDNARVYLDSNFIGLSPVIKDDLIDGTYRMRIEKEGYITKYQTIKIGNDKINKNDFYINLETGDSKQYYFTRTSAYYNLFLCSSFGIVLSSASYLYFSLKINDENVKPNSSQDKKDKYAFYKQISLYAAGITIISAGIFYYLDKTQYDIAIAFYSPQKNYFFNYDTFSFNSSSHYLSDKGLGIIFSKSF